MNQDDRSKFLPTLPDDDDINSPSNENDTFNDNSIKIYDGVAECVMNDSDNLKSVKIRAKNLAQENVQKKIADYVYAFLEDKYLALPDNEILSIVKEISNITDVKYNVFDSDDDNVIVRATVTAKIDDKDIMNCIIRFFKERTELKSQNESLRNEIEELKRKNNTLSKENEDLKHKIAERPDKIILANKKCHEAYSIQRKKDYKGAIKLYDEAIKLNPNLLMAYDNRGNCYKALGEEAKAKADFAKAKELGYKGW